MKKEEQALLSLLPPCFLFFLTMIPLRGNCILVVTLRFYPSAPTYISIHHHMGPYLSFSSPLCATPPPPLSSLSSHVLCINLYKIATTDSSLLLNTTHKPPDSVRLLHETFKHNLEKKSVTASIHQFPQDDP